MREVGILVISVTSKLHGYPLSSNIKRQYVHEVLRHSCDECNYKATQTTLLKEHKRSKHEGVKFPCA